MDKDTQGESLWPGGNVYKNVELKYIFCHKFFFKNHII